MSSPDIDETLLSAIEQAQRDEMVVEIPSFEFLLALVRRVGGDVVADRAKLTELWTEGPCVLAVIPATPGLEPMRCYASAGTINERRVLIVAMVVSSALYEFMRLSDLAGWLHDPPEDSEDTTQH